MIYVSLVSETNVGPFIFKNVWFPYGNTRNFKTCAIMERAARKVQEQRYAGNMKEQVCPSNVTENIENQYNKAGMRNRMQCKQQRPQRDKFGGGWDPPKGDPGWGKIAEPLELREHAQTHAYDLACPNTRI